MTELTFTIVKQRATPLAQVLIALVTGWVAMGVVHLMHFSPGKEYFGAFIGIIFFTLINTVASIANESYMKYTLPSYGLYFALVAVLFLSAKFLSGISIWSLWEYRMMFISVTLFYLVVSTLVRVLRGLYEMVSSDM